MIQNRYTIERFVSYVISRINWSRTLVTQPDHRFTFEQLVNIVDTLAYVLIALSDHFYIMDIDLESIPFSILTPQNVEKITQMLLPVMKQKMAKFSNNTTTESDSTIMDIFFKKTTKSPIISETPTFVENNCSENNNFQLMEENILLSLLRTVCDVQRNVKSNASSLSNHSMFHHHQLHNLFPKNSKYLDDSWFVLKNIHYTACISELIWHLLICTLNNNQSITNNKNSLTPTSETDSVRLFIQIWIDNMRSTLLYVLTSNDRILVFNAFLSLFNKIMISMVNDINRRRLATNFVSVCSYSLTTDSTLLGDMIISINRTVQSEQLVVYLLECFIEVYLDLRGDLQFLISNLNVNFAVGKAAVDSSSTSSINATNDEPTASNTIIESIQSQSSLLLLIHIYNRISRSTVPEQCTRKYVCKLLQKTSSFKPSPGHHQNESKIILYFFKAFTLLTGCFGTNGDDSVMSKLSIVSQTQEDQIAKFGLINHYQRSVVNISVNKFLTTSATSSRRNSNGNTNNVGNDNHLNMMINHNKFDFFENNDIFGSVKTLKILCKRLHETISNSVNRGWLFFRTQKQSSNWYICNVNVNIIMLTFFFLGVFSLWNH